MSEMNENDNKSNDGSMVDLLEDSKSVHSETSPLPKSMIIDDDQPSVSCQSKQSRHKKKPVK